MTPARIVATIAALTIREAIRRRVLLVLVGLTVILLALSGWGFSRLAAEAGAATLTSGEARPTASILLNLVMFGFSLIAALGTAFLAGPTLSGETESASRSPCSLDRYAAPGSFSASGSDLSPSGAASWSLRDLPVPRGPSDRRLLATATSHALFLLAAQTIVLFTLALLLSTAISPMASGVVAVGLFGATWIAASSEASAVHWATLPSLLSAASPTSSFPPTVCGGSDARIPRSLRHRPVRGYGRAGVSVPQRRITHGDLPRVGPALARPGVGLAAASFARKDL